MNFLAHYLLATEYLTPFEPLPPYAVGCALPDLLPLAALRLRLRLSNLPGAPQTEASDRAIAAGVRVHLTTDTAFHKTPSFEESQRTMGRLIDATQFTGIRVRRFFLAHVLVELALDAVLLRRRPQIAADFYGAFAAASVTKVTRWTEAATNQPLPHLPEVLARFGHSRYLLSYADDAGMAEGLNRLSVRARQDPFTGGNRRRLEQLVTAAIDSVNGSADALLAETAHAVLTGQPPTMEK